MVRLLKFRMIAAERDYEVAGVCIWTKPGGKCKAARQVTVRIENVRISSQSSLNNRDTLIRNERSDDLKRNFGQRRLRVCQLRRHDKRAHAEQVELEAGEYTYYCDVPGHRATMEGRVTVSDDAEVAPGPGGEEDPSEPGADTSGNGAASEVATEG